MTVRALIEALDRFDLSGNRPIADFLCREYLPTQTDLPPIFNRDDPYYRKYDLVSTIYRLSALLGWIELYRIDPEFMSCVPAERVSFETAFNRIRTILSGDSDAVARMEGGSSSNFAVWKGDGVILADDQRAIGERMLSVADDKGRVAGYASFAESLFRYPSCSRPEQEPGEGKYHDRPQDHWVWNATSFVVGIGDTTGPDFRVVRLRLLVGVLRELLSKLLPVELQNGLAVVQVPWYLRE